MRARLWLVAGGLVLWRSSHVPAHRSATPRRRRRGPGHRIAFRVVRGETRLVPQDYPTIQAAVDAAAPGDLVLIDRRHYREQVEVTTPGLTIRGVDRNEVIIDGEFQRANGDQGLLRRRGGVENLTPCTTPSATVSSGPACAATAAPISPPSTTTSTGSMPSTPATASSSTLTPPALPMPGSTSGNADPCQAIITDSIAEWNGLGYSGTNASVDLYIVNSTFRHNVAGIAPNTLDGELLPPFHGGDGRRETWSTTTGTSRPRPTPSSGRLRATGSCSPEVETTPSSPRNRVFNHPQSGIVIFPMLDDNFYMSYDHEIVANLVEGSGSPISRSAGPSASGNCFEDNEFSTTLPAALEFKQPCEGLRLPALVRVRVDHRPTGASLRERESAPARDRRSASMPTRATAQRCREAPMPRSCRRSNVFVESQTRHREHFGSPRCRLAWKSPRQKGINVMGVSLASAAGVFFGLYAYVLAPGPLHLVGGHRDLGPIQA